MAYDFVRWGVAAGLFAVVLTVLIIKIKDKGKSALIASFTAIITFAVMLLVPIENFVYSFPTVEKVFGYRYHEKLLTYAECDEGAFCVGQKDESNFVYYAFDKDEKGYKLPTATGDKVIFLSSQYGIYMMKRFENQMIIVTQVKDSEYNGNKFESCSSGYYYYTIVDMAVDGQFSYPKLTCNGERVSLV